VDFCWGLVLMCQQEKGIMMIILWMFPKSWRYPQIIQAVNDQTIIIMT
jgi:hypothetical protein